MTSNIRNDIECNHIEQDLDILVFDEFEVFSNRWHQGLWRDCLRTFLQWTDRWTWCLGGPFDAASTSPSHWKVWSATPSLIHSRSCAVGLRCRSRHRSHRICSSSLIRETAMFSPCWRASLEAVNSASQMDLAIRSRLLERHWTRLPPFFLSEVIPWYTISPCWLFSPVGAKEASPRTHNLCLVSGGIGTYCMANPKVRCRYWHICWTQIKQESGSCAIKLAARLG